MSANRVDVLQSERAATRLLRRAIVAATVVTVVSGATAGAQSATQVVRFRVIAQSRAEVAPIARPVSLHSTGAGVSTSALTLSTNDAGLKLTASIDRPLPAGTSVSLVLGDQSAREVSGGRQLGTDATDVLMQVVPTDGSRIPIAYRVTGGNDSAPRAGEQRLVTYTIIAAP